MTAAAPCPACGQPLQALDATPHPGRAMISDGTVVADQLLRVSCDACGLALRCPDGSEALPRCGDYAGYQLAQVAGAAARDRAMAHAQLIAGLLERTQPKRVLDVGCGNGAVMFDLADRWPEAVFVGVDPAPGNCDSVRDRCQIVRGRFESSALVQDSKRPGGGFDLIYSINVIEHVADPRVLLRKACQLLDPAGTFVLICPDGARVTTELLFYDHLYSFTTASLTRMAHDSGLQLVRSEQVMGEFQALVLRRGSVRCLDHGHDYSELSRQRNALLQSWSRLDARMLARMAACGRARRVLMFGAGEMAQLLRCYCPRVWSHVDALVVDRPFEGRPMDRPVFATTQLDLRSHDCVILAVHERHLCALRTRFAAHDTLSWREFIDVHTP